MDVKNGDILNRSLYIEVLTAVRYIGVRYIGVLLHLISSNIAVLPLRF